MAKSFNLSYPLFLSVLKYIILLRYKYTLDTIPLIFISKQHQLQWPIWSIPIFIFPKLYHSCFRSIPVYTDRRTGSRRTHMFHSGMVWSHTMLTRPLCLMKWQKNIGLCKCIELRLGIEVILSLYIRLISNVITMLYMYTCTDIYVYIVVIWRIFYTQWDAVSNWTIIAFCHVLTVQRIKEHLLPIHI